MLSVSSQRCINSLPTDKILDCSKLKAFADDIVDVTKKLKFVVRSLENIVVKGEKCWLPAFSPFPTMFLKGFFPRVIKSPDCVVELNPFLQERTTDFSSK